MKQAILSVWLWIKDDWNSNWFRFVIELVAWAISIGIAIAFAASVPNPPLRILYPIWMTGCLLYAWAAWTRRSFGMLANYALMFVIDFVGLIRLWG